jgi:hypothetical protein
MEKRLLPRPDQATNPLDYGKWNLREIVSSEKGEMINHKLATPEESQIIVKRGRFGFTGEELDFIINYDIKYRMGKEDIEEGKQFLNSSFCLR